MKPEYKVILANVGSAFNAAKSINDIQTQVSKIIDSYPKVIKSILPIFVTIVANPNDDVLSKANNLGNGVYTIISPEIDGDTTVFAIQARFASIKIPADIERCLITISTQADFMEKRNSSAQCANPDEDSPKFIPSTPKHSFNDIIISDNLRNRILKALAIIQHKELIYKIWGFEKIDKATKSVLCFYGPAGTGKTMTAEAIGSFLGKKIIHSSYAEIESQWVGVGAKNLHAIFKAAEENDAILFFDEADSFLSNRLSHTSSSSDKHYNRMSNELFQLIEDFNGCVIFATNLLTDIDEAFKSRIIDSIKFELPNEIERVQIIRKMIPSDFPLETEFSDDDFSKLAAISDDFSGRDIRKSMLLSLASAAILFSTNEKKSFSISDIQYGFNEVKNSKEEMEKELGLTDGAKIGETLLDHQIFNEKIVSMAKLACLSDGIIDVREQNMINDLSRTLLGVEIKESDISLSKEESLNDVCSGLKDNTQKAQLLDVAIRIIAADNQVLDEEINFLKSVMAELSVNPDKVNSLIEYTKHMAVNNLELESIQNNLFTN